MRQNVSCTNVYEDIRETESSERICFLTPFDFSTVVVVRISIRSLARTQTHTHTEGIIYQWHTQHTFVSGGKKHL